MVIYCQNGNVNVLEKKVKYSKNQVLKRISYCLLVFILLVTFEDVDVDVARSQILYRVISIITLTVVRYVHKGYFLLLLG